MTPNRLGLRKLPNTRGPMPMPRAAFMTPPIRIKDFRRIRELLELLGAGYQLNREYLGSLRRRAVILRMQEVVELIDIFINQLKTQGSNSVTFGDFIDGLFAVLFRNLSNRDITEVLSFTTLAGALQERIKRIFLNRTGGDIFAMLRRLGYFKFGNFASLEGFLNQDRIVNMLLQNLPDGSVGQDAIQTILDLYSQTVGRDTYRLRLAIENLTKIINEGGDVANLTRNIMEIRQITLELMDNFFTALEDADIPQEVIEMIRRSTENGTRKADDTIEQLLQDLISGIIVAAGRNT
tara:strand:- start:180 stop:1061 length:882 start_codon:yes stop_codon:yes gene_type:complete